MNKNVAIVYRPDKPEALQTASEAVAWLKKNGFKAFTAPDQKLLKNTTKATLKDLAKMGLIISIGGDGTYLRAVRMLEGKTIPILGVNLGSLGFLTTTRAKDMTAHIKKTFEGKMEFCPRMMNEVCIKRKNKVYKMFLSLNDVVIERGPLSQLINIGIYNADFLVSDVKADGLIISSPTGSTAYNLAAGGPVMHPAVKAIVVTAIAPHSLTTRPFIFPDNQELSFRLNTKTQKANLIVDGKKEFELTIQDEVVIKRSSQDHLMVLEPNYNYFNLLREKLKFGDRA